MAALFLLDPTLPHMCAALLAMVFLVGAWQKLRDMATLEMAIEQYRLLPASTASAAGWGLVAAEVTAGVLLLPLATRQIGVVMAVLLLLLVTSAVAINLLRGRRAIDCGCGGPEGNQHLSWGLVLRNGLLGLAAMVVASAPTSRELVWLDGLTVLAGALALYGVYAAANQLMGNHPKLLKLKG